MDMLEAGKGLGKRSGGIERKNEIDWFLLSLLGIGHQYAYFVSVLDTLKALQCAY